MFYEQKLKKLKEKHKKEIEELEYWYKIEKDFEKRKKRGEEKFALNFEHQSKLGFCCDNESRIEAIAKLYGYKIVDEKITSLNSKYVFEIEKHNN